MCLSRDIEAEPSCYFKDLVYYNAKRPHLSLNLQTPLQFIAQNNKMSQMYLTNTKYVI